MSLQWKVNYLGFTCPSTHASSTNHLDVVLYLAKLKGKGHHKYSSLFFMPQILATHFPAVQMSASAKFSCLVYFTSARKSQPALHHYQLVMLLFHPPHSSPLCSCIARFFCLLFWSMKKNEVMEYITSNSKYSQQFLQ